jgi:nucleotide-binding universal stress UspA family protein
VSHEVRAGVPAGELLACARERGADLVVVGRQGTHHGARDWLGSTAECVLRYSTVSMLLVATPRDATPARLLLALDDDDSAVALLQGARELGHRFGAHVLALHVLHAAPPVSDVAMAQVGAGGIAVNPTQLERELRAESRRWQERALEAGFARNDVHTACAIGDPGREIVDAAVRDRSDLIVIGNRRGGAGRTLLNSVVRAVLRHAPCPVLALTPPIDEIVEEEEEERPIT